MPGPKPIEEAGFDPDTLTMAIRAFTEAWSSISHAYQDPGEIEYTRLILAQAVVVAARHKSDREVLKQIGLRAIQAGPGTCSKRGREATREPWLMWFPWSA